MTDAATDPTGLILEYCSDVSYDELPDEVTEKLKHHLLDILGVMIGAREHAESSPAIQAGVDALAGSTTGDEATALATGERYTAEHAALLNGAYAHSLDFDDTHRESSLHPAAAVVPATLAIAERDGASTEDLLAAINVGYDVTCLLGRAVNPDAHYDQGFHITATCGTFGATAATGVLAGLSREELASALGINGSQTAGSLQFLENGAWNKRLHPGLAARRAIAAVSLADAGFRGATHPIEGDNGFFVGYTTDPDPAVFDDLGDRHAVLETGLKPYPCCRYMHPALDGLLAIAPSVDSAEIESIRIELPKSGVKLTGDPIDDKRRPSNFVNCQFSMPFGAAIALGTGGAGLEAFLDAQAELDDPELRRLMDATDVITTDAVQSLFPEQWAARVVVETTTDTHEEFVDTARGEPEKPLSWEAIVEKFESLVSTAGYSPDASADIAEAVRNLESNSVDDLLDRLRRPAPTASDD